MDTATPQSVAQRYEDIRAGRIVSSERALREMQPYQVSGSMAPGQGPQAMAIELPNKNIAAWARIPGNRIPSRFPRWLVAESTATASPEQLARVFGPTASATWETFLEGNDLINPAPVSFRLLGQPLQPAVDAEQRGWPAAHTALPGLAPLFSGQTGFFMDGSNNETTVRRSEQASWMELNSNRAGGFFNLTFFPVIRIAQTTVRNAAVPMEVAVAPVMYACVLTNMELSAGMTYANVVPPDFVDVSGIAVDKRFVSGRDAALAIQAALSIDPATIPARLKGQLRMWIVPCVEPDVFMTRATAFGARGWMFSGSSLGHAVRMCRLGGPPVMYTGYFRDFQDAELPNDVRGEGRINPLKQSPDPPYGYPENTGPFVAVTEALPLVESVDHIPYKVLFAANAWFPLVIPGYDSMMTPLFQSVTEARLRSRKLMALLPETLFGMGDLVNGEDWYRNPSPILVSNTVADSFILASLVSVQMLLPGYTMNASNWRAYSEAAAGQLADTATGRWQQRTNTLATRDARRVTGFNPAVDNEALAMIRGQQQDQKDLNKAQAKAAERKKKAKKANLTKQRRDAKKAKAAASAKAQAVKSALYLHGDKQKAQTPAGGSVTALEDLLAVASGVPILAGENEARMQSRLNELRVARERRLAALRGAEEDLVEDQPVQDYEYEDEEDAAGGTAGGGAAASPAPPRIRVPRTKATKMVELKPKAVAPTADQAGEKRVAAGGKSIPITELLKEGARTRRGQHGEDRDSSRADALRRARAGESIDDILSSKRVFDYL